MGADGRSNWELSSDRANAARRVLVQNGVDPAHVRNVVGRADTDPFIKDNPADPQNRRISIVLLSDVHERTRRRGRPTGSACDAHRTGCAGRASRPPGRNHPAGRWRRQIEPLRQSREAAIVALALLRPLGTYRGWTPRRIVIP